MQNLPLPAEVNESLALSFGFLGRDASIYMYFPGTEMVITYIKWLKEPKNNLILGGKTMIMVRGVFLSLAKFSSVHLKTFLASKKNAYKFDSI